MTTPHFPRIFLSFYAMVFRSYPNHSSSGNLKNRFFSCFLSNITHCVVISYNNYAHFAFWPDLYYYNKVKNVHKSLTALFFYFLFL